jgi:hypothetical protein
MARGTTDSDKAGQDPDGEAGGGREGTVAGGKDPLAAELGRRGGLKGGKARAAKLSPERRRAIAQQAAAKRWARQAAGEQPATLGTATARGRGTLHLAGHSLEGFVLDDGRRVIGLRSVMAALPGLRLDPEVDALTFSVPGDWQLGRGVTVERLLDLCRARLPGSEGAGSDPALALRCQGLIAECALEGLATLVDRAAQPVAPVGSG